MEVERFQGTTDRGLWDSTDTGEVYLQLTLGDDQRSSASYHAEWTCEEVPPETTTTAVETTTTVVDTTTTVADTTTTVPVTTTTVQICAVSDCNVVDPPTTTTMPSTTVPTTATTSPTTTTVPPSIPSGIPTGIGEPDASGQGPVFWFFILMVGTSGGIIGGLGAQWWARQRQRS
jgi:hypothetical protein